MTERLIAVKEDNLELAKCYIYAFIKDAEENKRMSSYDTARHYYEMLDLFKLLNPDENIVITERLNKFWDEYMKMPSGAATP